MKYLLLIYNDPELLDALPKPEFDQRLAHCYEHARGLMASAATPARSPTDRSPRPGSSWPAST
jgi:hypothetical protein